MPTVSPQLVLANRLLQVSSMELEQAIARELAENPALEMEETRQCPTCGARISDDSCPSCGEVEVRLGPLDTFQGEALYGDGTGLPRGRLDDEWDDPIARLPSSVTLADHLERQARLSLPDEDVAVAGHVIGNLDDRGFFCREVAEIATELGIEQERVERVLAVVQSLEPVGIGARDARECLLIQIADLDGKSPAWPDCDRRSVAEQLVRTQWDLLGRASLSRLAGEVNASVEDVRDALYFIRENLHPFPAHACWADDRRVVSKAETTCPQPDVIIRRSETSTLGFELEYPRAGSYALRVNASYCRSLDAVGADEKAPVARGWERWKELCGRARLFVKSIEQRWETLDALMRFLVDYQRDFLIHGEKRLRPLTRAQVAESMGVHEATVSRAVAGKYVELPCRHVVSMGTFFDSAAPIKHMIERLVDQEEEPLSDRAMAEMLAEHGYHISRRTVAKYRNALNILPSVLRKRGRDLSSPL